MEQHARVATQLATVPKAKRRTTSACTHKQAKVAETEGLALLARLVSAL